jgi:hypothetical protein
MSRDLAVVAIVKNEDKVIYEWLAHHAALGVQHFFLYDNGSTDGTRAEIDAFPERDRITVTEWPMAMGQMPAYADALKRFERHWRWMAFIDADEFFVLPEDPSIPAVLADYEDCDGLAVPWQLFGSNGHVRRPPGLVIENYTRRSHDDFAVRRHTKCIVQPSRIADIATNPHIFQSLNGRIVREDRQVVSERFSSLVDDFVPRRLRLHHYVVQSREDFEAKARRGLVAEAGPRDERFFTVHDRNEVEDCTALRHAAAIRDFQARRGEVRPAPRKRWFEF